jgi:hypothetical protein
VTANVRIELSWDAISFVGRSSEGLEKMREEIKSRIISVNA